MNTMPNDNRPVKPDQTTIKGGLKELHFKIINDLFEADLDESQINEKYGLRLGVLRRWLCDPAFEKELRSRMHAALAQARIRLSRFVPEAATRLVELAKCEKDETSRKACLDVIAMLLQEPSDRNAAFADEPAPRMGFSVKTVSELLGIIAQQEEKLVDRSNGSPQSASLSEPDDNR